MPGPDPHRLWIESAEPPYRVEWQPYDWTGNHGHRKARAIAILRRLSLGTWRCDWCGEGLPNYIRSDARYCNERCRKRSARERRAARQEVRFFP